MAGSSSTTTTTGAGSTISAVCPTAMGSGAQPLAETAHLGAVRADSTSIRRSSRAPARPQPCCLRCGCDALRGAGRASDGLRRRRAPRLPGPRPALPPRRPRPRRCGHPAPSGRLHAGGQRRLGGARRRGATGELRRRAPPRIGPAGCRRAPPATLPAGRRPARGLDPGRGGAGGRTGGLASPRQPRARAQPPPLGPHHGGGAGLPAAARRAARGRAARCCGSRSWQPRRGRRDRRRAGLRGRTDPGHEGGPPGPGVRPRRSSGAGPARSRAGAVRYAPRPWPNQRSSPS